MGSRLRKKKKFVIADIHGAYKALVQVLKKARFSYESDTLIVLGDTVDGYKQTKECLEELLKIKNLIYILGNHDEWALRWMLEGEWFGDYVWLTQGGENTKFSYDYDRSSIPKTHMQLLRNAHLFYTTSDNRLFVHGGYDRWIPFVKNDKDDFLWDRTLAHSVTNGDIDDKITFKEVYIGHTTTEIFKDPEGKGITKPIHSDKIWMMDTGAGWSGKLTILNIETKEYFQSDKVSELYPDEEGRG